MGPRADEKEFEVSFVLRVDKQPVRLDVAFAITAPVSRKRMVAVARRKGDVARKQPHDQFKLFKVKAAFRRRLAVALVLRRFDDVVLERRHVSFRFLAP